MRHIITINEATCNGCGNCVTGCPEGALAIIDGKARLVGEILCDGLGACIGNCPTGALTIEQRPAADYNEREVMKNVVAAGPAVIAAHLKHLKDHGQHDYHAQAVAFLKEQGLPLPVENTPSAAPHAAPPGPAHGMGGCPGSLARQFNRAERPAAQAGSSGPLASELMQWPIQLKLVNPAAPYFKDCELVIAADCVPFAFADFHRRFLAGKALVVFCPKLDGGFDLYVDKLAQLIRQNNIRSLTVLHMEVPCCFGTLKIAEDAVHASGHNVVIKEYTISVQGEIR